MQKYGILISSENQIQSIKFILSHFSPIFHILTSSLIRKYNTNMLANLDHPQENTKISYDIAGKKYNPKTNPREQLNFCRQLP